MQDSVLLSLLQLASPSLPVGAYSYSEGLETLVEQGKITDETALEQWLRDGLRLGSIRLDGAALIRGGEAMQKRDYAMLRYWNHWLLATRETEELRQQTVQMGRSLGLLLQTLVPDLAPILQELGPEWSYPLVFAISTQSWQISPANALLAYLQSWVSNLITAGVKLIPLGQTTGQKLLFQLHPHITAIVPEILALEDDNLYSCSWGFSLYCMAHETQYTRLFRS
ncbi:MULTISPECIES: urease accessory protein UreF [unclassified Roseofilum]|uniref:urease accessory protein UreF n=1 Tax=unclassified Roseofilum TaxID=2620099 RepID=UPI001B14623D|nr:MULTISPECIES: urease accessory protein UreF [unclassified Roseofilum]MBP0010672.1 urease accessory protein UreF [Roseofilum sp. Belize Diploria]MBP0035148.1 urease accessory protein UreF [Roseofilum sp. Belize BBD 4]